MNDSNPREDARPIPGSILAEEPPTQASRSDFELVRQAAKARWPIPDAIRRRAIAEAAAVIRNPLASNRSKNAAMRFLAEVDKINHEQERRDQGIAQVHEHRVTGRIDLANLTDDQLRKLAAGEGS